MSSALYPNISERSILFLVGAVQFINILDFMMVMPLGPDFAPALGISDAQLGWVGGSYTAAAAVSGVLTSLFIDKLDRKVAFLTAIAGLMTATALGGFTWSFGSLIATRVVAGMFGGPATSVAWSIVADVIEPARRGQAMGKVMGAFSLASIFGVPFGLEMAHLHNWTTPFFTTAAMGGIILLMTLKLMPPMRAHIAQKMDTVSFHHLFTLLLKPINALSYLYVTFAMLASFMIIPNISAYVQYNLHYPRADLGWLYSVGGMVSFVTMRMTGRLIDRWNASTTSFISTVTYACVLWIAFIHPIHGMPVVAIFMLFMFAMGMRNLSSTTLATKIPSPQERAGFMSLFSCIQGLAMSVGAFLSVHYLSENPDQSLNGMDRLASVSACISFLVPLLMRRVEKRMAKPQ
jgi:predicted MFS family arabinose efflux permease